MCHVDHDELPSVVIWVYNKKYKFPSQNIKVRSSEIV